MEMPKLIKRKDAAKILGVGESTLEHWVSERRNDLPYVKIGRMVRYDMSDIVNFVKKHRLMEKEGNEEECF